MLKARLPSCIIEGIKTKLPKKWYKFRKHNGFNIMREQLVLQWYHVSGQLDIVASIDDVIRAVEDRHTQATPDVPPYMRFHAGPTASFRAYITDDENEMMNQGACEFNTHRRRVEEVGEVQAVLRTHEKFVKVKAKNPVLDWVNNKADQDGLIDPNAYGECDCGAAAMKALRAYRYEVEHRYSPLTNKTFQKFPLRKYRGPDDRYISSVDEVRPPHCQKISQICEQHETKTDNIWILVDTSIEAINDRLSAPGGLLPVPGAGSLSQYPLDSKLRSDTLVCRMSNFLLDASTGVYISPIFALTS
jgi:hypothetical protein